ncbi:MerR family transcriptional regulator [Paenibacillus gallinarum]|uniref:MerR family transcriptional regulator n=1 Tax=Paenibacillus gallinarum TaxID=2762232 RepID=A0ABR8T6J5_9BACL|nr:MerR family transcriptional regulator [Paenibacillus gallinarum]MBD7971393.1 MerR family transcriptional regulator [Paenibacillus gallinarum]
MDRTYTTKDIAEMLGVEAVTIRKYCQALERTGYVINRSNGKDRVYTDQDAMTLKYLQTIRNRSGISVEAACIAVQAKKMAVTEDESVIDNIGEAGALSRYAKQYDILTSKVDAQAEQIGQLIELNQALIERLDSREEYERKRDYQVTEMLTAIREQKEATRQLAAVKEPKTFIQRILRK